LKVQKSKTKQTPQNNSITTEEEEERRKTKQETLTTPTRSHKPFDPYSDQPMECVQTALGKRRTQCKGGENNKI
jgi:hypothetical protein